MAFVTDSVLENAKRTIDELYVAVLEQESTYGRGDAGGKGAKALQALKDTKVTFGDPRNGLVRLGHHEAGVDGNPLFKKKFQGKKIYFLSMAVSLRSGNGAQFSRVRCELDFGQKKNQGVIIQQLFPVPEWKTVITYGANLKLALDSTLKWVIGLPDDNNVQQLQQTVAPDLKANLVNEDSLSAFVQVHPYAFEMGRTEIVATGSGSPTAFWDISKPDLRKVQTAKFIVVFTVPKEVRKVKLVGSVAAEPNFPFLVANLRDVWEYLDKKFQVLLKKLDDEKTPEEKLPKGDYQEWNIDVP